MIISAVNQKGGTGKTTVATNLAAYFAAEGREVILIDADPQRSALDWRADRPDDRLPVQTIGPPARNLHREIEPFRRKYEVIIIDGGGRVNATAKTAVTVSDFVSIPTLPSKPDIPSTQDFFKEVIEDVATIRDVQGAVLINQLQAGTVVSRRSREAIAVGLSVIEYDRTSKAAQELAACFDELKEALV